MTVRLAALAVLVVIAGCGRAPDPNAAADAARIEATARKAVGDVDSARRDAALRPELPEQTPG